MVACGKTAMTQILLKKSKGKIQIRRVMKGKNNRVTLLIVVMRERVVLR